MDFQRGRMIAYGQTLCGHTNVTLPCGFLTAIDETELEQNSWIPSWGTDWGSGGKWHREINYSHADYPGVNLLFSTDWPLGRDEKMSSLPKGKLYLVRLFAYATDYSEGTPFSFHGWSFENKPSYDEMSGNLKQLLLGYDVETEVTTADDGGGLLARCNFFKNPGPSEKERSKAKEQGLSYIQYYEYDCSVILSFTDDTFSIGCGPSGKLLSYRL